MTELENILQTRDSVIEAADLFLKREEGGPLATLGRAFNEAAASVQILDQDVTYMAGMGQRSIHHFQALVGVYAALTRKKLFLDEDLPDTPVNEKALEQLEDEAKQIRNAAQIVGQGTQMYIRQLSGIMDNPEEVGDALDHQFEMLAGADRFIPDIPETRPLALEALHRHSTGVIDAYKGLVATELDEIRWDLGYYFSLYATGDKPLRPVFRMFEASTRKAYSATLIEQVQTLAWNESLLELAAAKARGVMELIHTAPRQTPAASTPPAFLN